MINENLLNLMYGIAESASLRAREMEPNEIVSSDGYGDDKWDIDQVAEKDAFDYFFSNSESYGFDVVMKPEDAEWEDDEEWMASTGETVSIDDIGEFDYAIIIDQVEGTKNNDNRERYSTLAALDPENPTLEGVEASIVYRWDDVVFFSDGETAYRQTRTTDDLGESAILEADEMDEVDYLTKIRGQAIGKNTQDLTDLMYALVERYDLHENEWPSQKGDGTTTGDILGTVTDNSIAVDVRALKDRERVPFAQDFAPAAKIAQDAGAIITDEKGEAITTDFSKSGAETAYIASPPGKVSKDIVEIVNEEVL